MIKLIAFDVDGTLVEPGSPLPNSKVVSAIQNAQKQGVIISLCTGRSPDEIDDLLNELDLNPSYHVLGGGTSVLLPDGRVISSGTFSLSEVSFIQKAVEGLGEGVDYYVGISWKNFLPEKEYGGVGVISVRAKDMKEAQSIIASLSHLRTKFYIGPVSSSQDPVKAHVHISPLQNNKGAGLLRVMEILSLTREECACVGDMSNDIPMFEAVGCAVAMGNAPDSVKAKAHHVVASVFDDGAVEAIEYILRADR